MRIVDRDNTFISPIDKYGRITNEQIVIFARSGYGKGLTSEGLVEWYHKHGYIAIIIADPKNESEYAYQMFPPQEKYHLNHLNNIASAYLGSWKLPHRQNVKLYHPFTFSLPKTLIPKMNIFTIPLKSLGRSEWGLLSEVHGENETVSVLLKASEEINNEDGLYSFAHYVQDSVKGKGEKKKKADWKNFGLEATSGTMKEVSKISNILRPFKKHFFLSKQNCEYNIDWRSILTDQKNYHVFLSNYIGRNEEKLTDFLVLYLLENILKNKKYLKHPVLIVIPEISKLCPFKPVGHKEFLSDSIKKALKTIRSEGKGMSSILDSQVWGDVDDDLRGSSTIQIYGELGDIKDVENICKATGYKGKVKENMNKAEIPRTYLIRGVEDGSVDDGGYLFFYPSAMHCEPHYNFEEMYREHNQKDPETYPMMSCREIIEKISKDFKDEEDKMKKKIQKREKELEEIENKKKLEKENNQKENLESEKVKEELKEVKSKTDAEMKKIIYDYYMGLEKKSFSAVGKKFGKDHKTIKKWLQEYSEKIEAEKNLPQF